MWVNVDINCSPEIFFKHSHVSEMTHFVSVERKTLTQSISQSIHSEHSLSIFIFKLNELTPHAPNSSLKMQTVAILGRF